MLIFLIYFILSPLIYFFLVIASIFNKKIRTVLFNKNKTFYRKNFNTNKKKLVIHAASAGEYEQIKPLLRKIDHDLYFVIVTCMSPTIYEDLSKNKEIDFYCYHPIDFPWNPKKFFSTIMPSIYITTRHDIWPMHLYYAKRMNIKTFLINANLYEKSLRLKWFSKSFTKFIYSQFDKVIVPSNLIEKLFNDLIGNDKILLIDDTRYEQILHRKETSEGIGIFENIKNYKNIIFGSISEKDLFLFNNKDINSVVSYPGFIIIVPHEIDNDLIKKIESKFKYAVRFSDIKDGSKIKKSSDSSTAIIVDKVGILPELYKYSKIAYVGGGFGKGVHNTFEPLVYNNIVCYGPNIDLLNEAKEMHKSGCGYIIKNYSNLSKIVSNQFSSNLISNTSDLSSKKKTEEINLFINSKKQSSESIYEVIKKYS